MQWSLQFCSRSEPILKDLKKKIDKTSCLSKKQTDKTLHPMCGLSGFFITLSVVSFQCNVLFLCVFVVSFFLYPWNSILSRTGKKETQDASNLAVPMTMCLFPVPFPLTPSLRPQVSSINPSVTRSLLYSVLRDTPSDRGQQSRDAQLSDYPSLDYQGLYVTLVTVLDLVPLLQHGQHGKLQPKVLVCGHCGPSLSGCLF